VGRRRERGERVLVRLIPSSPSPASSSASGAAAARDRGRPRERLEAEHARAREQRRVHRERRVLRRRADERDRAVLDVRQERVLLRLVEAVDLVDEEDRALRRVDARSLERASILRSSGTPRAPR
jgi:hypothetical protein